MAISAPAKSAQYANYTASPRVMVKPTDWGANIKASYGKLTFTAAGFTTDGAGDLQLIRMPAGRLRILPDLSRVICPAGSATSVLNVGFGKHLDQDGVTVALDGDAFLDAHALGATAADVAFTAATEQGLEFYSQDGFDIVADFSVANSPASGDMIVVVAYLLGR